jgi:hypothetical protein
MWVDLFLAPTRHLPPVYSGGVRVQSRHYNRIGLQVLDHRGTYSGRPPSVVLSTILSYTREHSEDDFFIEQNKKEVRRGGERRDRMK